uniref:Uncharacterized protein n=1 Tax=Polytomella parva TaxID=51329 RepID=A0A7S0V944_9CHLO|mmetsp:Transcript_33368/g.60291  ORF Transcript_33368/g.60291 Transcript_33368/m.60291 type:complete len:483 (+) Transcript_33368:101-1549(+)
MSQIAIEKSLQLLKELRTTNGSVHEEIRQLLVKLLDEKPKDAYASLESLLGPIEATFNARESLPLVPQTSSASAAKTVATLNVFGPPDSRIDPDTGEAMEPEGTNDYECEDVEGDAELFDALGVGLGRREMTTIALTVKFLGEDLKRNVATVRFFGKFFGIQGDYFVFETTLKENPEMPEAPEGQVPYEPYGEGANAYVYYVCSYLGGPMTQLPYVLPSQIKAARAVKHFLTGKLDAPVSSYPPFPGSESNFLRCQIARIAASTICCPVGLFEADEETNEVNKAEEFTPKSGREMSLAINWSHRYSHLKMQGRCELYKREPPEELEEEADIEKFYNEEEREVPPPPLRTLDKDAPLYSQPILAVRAAKAVKEAGIGKPLPPPPVPATASGAANILPAWTSLSSSTAPGFQGLVGGVRSNTWPGAVCACRGTHFTNIYVGWGVKEEYYKPAPPPLVAPDFTELPAESNDLPPKPAAPEEEEDA